MVVDDDKGILSTIIPLIEQLGAEGFVFSSPTKALISWASNYYDGVIVDLMMPVMGGLDFLDQIGDVKAIIMSGYLSSRAGRDFYSKYVFLPKPFSKAELKMALVESKILKF